LEEPSEEPLELGLNMDLELLVDIEEGDMMEVDYMVVVDYMEEVDYMMEDIVEDYMVAVDHNFEEHILEEAELNIHLLLHHYILGQRSILPGLNYNQNYNLNTFFYILLNYLLKKRKIDYIY
jgi:hypothetical protein